MRDGTKTTWTLLSAALALLVTGCPTYIVISSDAGVAATAAAGAAGEAGAYAGTGYGGGMGGTVGGYPGGFGGVGGSYPTGGTGGVAGTYCGTGGSGEPFCVPAPGIYAPCADCARLGETWVFVADDGYTWIDCTILEGQEGCYEYCAERCDPSSGCGMGGAGGWGGAGTGGAGGWGGAGTGGVGGGPACDPGAGGMAANNCGMSCGETGEQFIHEDGAGGFAVCTVLQGYPCITDCIWTCNVTPEDPRCFGNVGGMAAGGAGGSPAQYDAGAP